MLSSITSSRDRVRRVVVPGVVDCLNDIRRIPKSANFHQVTLDRLGSISSSSDPTIERHKFVDNKTHQLTSENIKRNYIQLRTLWDQLNDLTEG